MIKEILIQFPNCEIWAIDASEIATDRAYYYAGREGADVYKLEYDYAINDKEELIDWLFNNMNWDDIKHKRLYVKNDMKYDYSKKFIESHFVGIRSD